MAPVQIDVGLLCGEDPVAELFKQLEAAGLRPHGTNPVAVRVGIGVPPLQRRRLLGLPPTSRRNLVELIAHQSYRYFRVTDAGLVVDAKWIPGRKKGVRCALAVGLDATIPRAILDGSEGFGVRILDIVPVADDLPKGLSLLPDDERRGRRAAAWRSTLRAARATLIVWGLLLALVVGWRGLENRAMTAELNRLRGPSRIVLQVRSGMDTMATMLATLDQAGRGRAVLGKHLTEVARVLPDSTVLTSILVSRAGIGQMSGLAREPLRVLAGLQGSAAFRTAKLAGSPTVEERGGVIWSRFTIQIDSGGVR